MSTTLPQIYDQQHQERTPPAINTGRFSVQDWGLFIGVSLIWGSSFLLIAFSLEGLTPGAITFGRIGLGALTLGALRLSRVEYRQRIDPSDRLRLVALSVVWVAVPFTLFPLAQEQINSALTGLVNGSIPIWTALLSALFLGRAPKARQRTGIAIGFVGIVCISLPAINEGSSQTKGILLVLGATVCYGLAINLAPPLQQRYGAVTLMSSVLGLAAIWVAPFGIIGFGQNKWSFIPLVALTTLGVVGTGLAYWIMATLVGRVGPIRASMITYLMPVVSLALGAVVRNDVVATLAIFGTGFVILEALLAARSEQSPRSTS